MENSEVYALCQKVAKELGDGWKAQLREGMTGAYLDHEDGRQLHVWNGWNNGGKVAISGNFTRDMHDVYSFTGDDYRTNEEINVSADRGAQVIAREINRRLLPKYTATYEKARQRVTDAYADAKARQEVLAEVCKLLGKPVPNVTDGMNEWQAEEAMRRMLKGHDSEVRLDAAGGYGDVSVSGDGSRITVHARYIPKEKALAMLRVLVSA